MENFKLVGHSGCKLEIEEHGKCLMVVKTSKNKDYNDRLKRQCEKQKKFRSDSLYTPTVFDSQEDKDGLFKFSMEYINGQTLADYFKDIKISSIAVIAQKFLKMIPNNYEFDPNAKKIFSLKIEELEKKINTKGNKILKKAITQLKKYDWGRCAASNCHGDLTLENIIWKDGDLYLIDFLDSFYDSWMIDLAKIFQDVECFWSYRHQEKIDENLEIRLLILKRLLLDKLLSLPNGHILLESIYHMLLINLLRIIPYTKDKNTNRHLKREINKIINKIDYL